MKIRKYFNIDYIMPILVIIIFFIGAFGCDNPFVPKPDIRKEFKDGKTLDYFGLKWGENGRKR